MNVRMLCTDGGCVGKNPSLIAGTWSWVLVEGGRLVACDYGLIYPCDLDLPAASNNNMELYAAVRGIEHAARNGLPFEWRTDSLVTLRRLTGGKKFNGVPGWLRERSRKLVQDNKKGLWTATLLSGHPTKAELKIGKDRSTGRPVCRWNAMADSLCRTAAKEVFK